MDTNMRYDRPPERADADCHPGEHQIPRSNATRVVHLLLLVVVLNQLAGSQFMHRPFPGDAPELIYTLHQYAGLAGFAVVLGFWVWTLVRRGETSPGRLMPWFSPRRIRDVVADLAVQVRRMVHRQGPDDNDGALSRAGHGLGLLAGLAMAASGTLWFFVGGPAAHLAMSVHKTIANLVWAYLFAHAGLAVLHHLLGSNIFSRMFWPTLRRPARLSQEA